MDADVAVMPAEPADAGAIAEIQLASRREAMPYVRRPWTDAETRGWFVAALRERPAGWRVASSAGHIVGYMLLFGAEFEHLYVAPAWQGRVVGAASLEKPRR